MGKPIRKANPERQRIRYSKEFKLEAVRLLELGEKPATQLAAKLGIRRNQLYKWQVQLSSKGQEVAFQGPGRPSNDKDTEIARLKRELAKVTEEQDIFLVLSIYIDMNAGHHRVSVISIGRLTTG
jgi:transposase